jgi:L-malate glycosyltransferase
VSDALPVVYVVDASVAVTGAFISARHIAHALQQDARCVLVLPKGSVISPQECAAFWRVEYIPLVNLSKNLSALLRYLPALFAGSWKLKRLMRRDGATRLHLNDFFLMQGAVLRLLGYRGHIATWVRCEPVRFAGPLARPMLALAAGSANRMVAVSSFIRSLLPARYGVEVIYNFYAGLTRTPRTWDAAEAKPLVYVGNYIQGKGQEMALEAFALAAAQDATLTLAFYGADMGLQKNRDYRSMLQQRAQQLGIAARIQFHDFIPDTYAVLETAYAALNFSVSESFSRTVLEASGAGVPVIATASGGPQEILQDGVTGYLVPVGDVAAAAERIITLAQDVQKGATMGEAGAAHIAAQFSEGATTPALRKVLKL